MQKNQAPIRDSVDRLKPSRYNLFIPFFEDGKYILYNTLKGSVLVANEEAKKALENFSYCETAFDKDLINTLQKEGMLVSDFVDELTVFKVHRDRAKYSSNKLSLAILTTYECNMKCIYCCSKLLWNDRQLEVPHISMNEETIESVLTFIMRIASENEYSEIVIDFVGLGEPFIRPEIFLRIIEGLSTYVNENGIILRVNILSNGTLMSESVLRVLRKYNTYIQITLDGPEKIHNKKRMYRNNKGTYNKIIKNLELLIDVGIKFALRINVDNINYDHMDELLDELKDKFGEGLYIRFSLLLPGKDENCVWSKSCFALEEIEKISTLWEKASDKGFNPLFRPLINFLSCKAMSDHCYVIDPLGDVYKCEGLCGNEDLRIGKIKMDGSLSEMGAPYFSWMTLDPLDVDECRNCVLLPTCGGECPELQYYYQGNCCLGSCTKNKEFLINNISFQLRKFYLNNSCSTIKK